MRRFVFKFLWVSFSFFQTFLSLWCSDWSGSRASNYLSSSSRTTSLRPNLRYFGILACIIFRLCHRSDPCLYVIDCTRSTWEVCTEHVFKTFVSVVPVKFVGECSKCFRNNVRKQFLSEQTTTTHVFYFSDLYTVKTASCLNKLRQ